MEIGIEKGELSESQRHLLPRKEDGTPYRFMIVDDSEFMVNNLRRIVIGFGCEVVETAGDGADAVVRYKSISPKPDIVTMDLTMPNMGGFEAIQRVLEVDKTQRIVVVSAIGAKESVQRAILLGAKHFVVKPFKRDDVYRVFRSVLGVRG